MLRKLVVASKDTPTRFDLIDKSLPLPEQFKTVMRLLTRVSDLDKWLAANPSLDINVKDEQGSADKGHTFTNVRL